MSFKTALVLGAGAFGTSMASVLAHNFKKVILKVRSEDIYQALLQGENAVYLPGRKLAVNIVPALTFDEVDQLIDEKIDLIVYALPASAIHSYLDKFHNSLKKYLNQKIPMVSICKGIDAETLELPDELFHHHFFDYKDQLIYLSGPSFAKEILAKQITVVSIAGRDITRLKLVSKMFNTNYFKTFLTFDIKGLLLGGALKNVLAISCGIVEGLGFNHNTRAAMITRGIYEMLRFGSVFNAKAETFYGLSGMGDLILTSTGEMSRNKSFGLEIAKGRTPEEIIDSKRTVVEGYKTTKAVHLLAQKYQIRCLIFNSTYKVLYENRDPKKMIKDLMRGQPRFEI